ncbi:MAG: ATP-binding protein [Candidatus Schekmanbacteria bacterium]|nr:ATP-binding protein [Candidatus Schekmanbacteria bacterium]
MEIIKRIFKPGKQSFFLLGPRGTGKSTLIKNIFPNTLYIDLLLPDIFRSYSARPERLIEIVHANTDKKVVVIDEIQKAPQLLEVVHSLIEEKKDRQFILTGSSARKLKKTGVNLLAGRVIMKHMHPFVAAELSGKFNLNAALQNGMIPVVLDSINPVDSLHAYVDLYIREEVQMEGLTRNIGNFSRFLEAVSFSHGSVLNISNISRECHIERKVVEGYVNILEDLLLSFRIPVFTRRAKRTVSQHPKFYFFDAGIYNCLRPSGPLDRPQEKSGVALEGLVAQHLKAWIDYNHPDCRLFFWRTSSGTEIDFIVYGKGIFWAIEVKNTTTVRPEDIRSLKTFGDDYPEAKKFFIYHGKEKLKRDGILIMPCTEFLMTLS